MYSPSAWWLSALVSHTSNQTWAPPSLLGAGHIQVWLTAPPEEDVATSSARCGQFTGATGATRGADGAPSTGAGSASAPTNMITDKAAVPARMTPPDESNSCEANSPARPAGCVR